MVSKEKKGLGRRTPREIIKSVENPKLEEYWSKYPREEPIVASGMRAENNVKPDYKRMEEEYKRTGKRIMSIHTHPFRQGIFETPEYIKFHTLVSPEDLKNFLLEKQEKSMTIGTTDNGRLYGYTIIRKTKKTPELKNIPELDNVLDKYGLEVYRGQITDNINHARDSLQEICHKYHLQYKFIPAKKNEQSAERHAHSGLEKHAVTAGILLVFASLVFSAASITGNVINNSDNILVKITGAVLFLLGIFLMFIVSRKS